MLRSRPLLVTLATACALGAASAAHAQPPAFQTPRASQKATLTQTVGATDLTVVYSRPGVKKRAIWGGLVPYGKPWRTGANEATQFITTDELTIEGQKLPAGTYALLTIPERDRWTIVFSKQKDMWGAFTYDPAQDQLRVTVTPAAAPPCEWMQFTFDDPSWSDVTLALRWEKLRVPVHIAVDTNGKVLAQARTAVAAAKPDDWRTPYRAASWCLDANVAAGEAADWGKTALDRQQNFYTATLAAKLARKRGDFASAADWMTRSIAFGKADTTIEKEQIEANEKQLAEWGAKH